MKGECPLNSIVTLWTLSAAFFKIILPTLVEPVIDTFLINSNKIDFDSRTYVDVSAKYSATENLMVTFGINNLFDDEPGYTSDAGTAPGNGNTFPGYFDAFGQYIFLNLTLQY